VITEKEKREVVHPMQFSSIIFSYIFGEGGEEKKRAWWPVEKKKKGYKSLSGRRMSSV